MRDRAEALLAEAARGLEGTTVETALVEADDVVQAIVETSRDHDVTIIGATREVLLQRILFGAISEAVGRRSGNTVIMTKRYLGITSLLRRWLGWK